ncbi:MAG: hypothetical protein A2Y76_10295 [Planctomycetes bacterium RBG_13_60_9]|nr:MAG: hypothetical protein A2Y76_10295 [Planctomycetes bacterium RBG_13_60_9]
MDPKLTVRIANTRRRGVALVLVVGLMLIFLALGTGTLYCGFQNRLLALHDTQQVVARAAADAGLKKAVWEMASYESGDLPSATDEILPGCTASYSYEITDNLDGTFSVTSTGALGAAARTIGCRLVSSSVLWSGVTLGTNVSLESNSRIKASSGGSRRLRINSIAPDKVYLKSNSVIEGDVMVGPGGDPDTVIALQSGGQVTGERLVAESTLDFPPVIAPSGLPNCGSVQINNPQVISSSGMYSSLTIQGPQVEIAGDIVLYVVGDLTIRSSAQLLVRDGARLTLYVGGTLSLESSSTMKEVNLRPEKLTIYGTQTCTRIDIKSSSTACAAIYAPAAECSLNSSSVLAGVFSGKSLDLKSSSELHYDAAVDGHCLYGTNTYRIDRWWEN